MTPQELFDAHAGQVRRWAKRWGKRITILPPEDMAQAALMGLWEAACAFPADSEKPFEGWAYNYARRRTTGAIRNALLCGPKYALYRYRNKLPIDINFSLFRYPPEDKRRSHVEIVDEKDLVEFALLKLSPGRAALARRYYIDEVPLVDIAKERGKDARNLHGIVYKARNCLREMIIEETS